jgi:hypothetical protein
MAIKAGFWVIRLNASKPVIPENASAFIRDRKKAPRQSS